MNIVTGPNPRRDVSTCAGELKVFWQFPFNEMYVISAKNDKTRWKRISKPADADDGMNIFYKLNSESDGVCAQATSRHWYHQHFTFFILDI